MSKRLRVSVPKLVLGCTALIVLYFLVTGAVNLVRGVQLHEQEGQLRKEIRDLQSRYRRLEALKDYVDSDEYIEAVAREQLGFVREGETGFVIISTGATPTPRPGDERPELWWELITQ